MDTKHFKPAWWLKNSHLQTIWPTICRPKDKDLPLERERVELPDGDFLDIDWVNREKSAPTVLILHGFEGSINSHYAKGTLRCVAEQGWRGAFMHQRGCSGEPNRLIRSYHSGATDDIAYIVNFLNEREKNPVVAAIGYSLGGNILLKWMGETEKTNPLKAAIAISVPFDLHVASKKINAGFSRLYQWYLVSYAKKKLMDKFKNQSNEKYNLELLATINSLRDYDSLYTVPVHGFESVDEYYSQTSSRHYLKTISVPTLLLHAKDDPFMTEEAIPQPNELSSKVKLELTETGGHVGFITGMVPWRPIYWLETRIPQYLKKYLR